MRRLFVAIACMLSLGCAAPVATAPRLTVTAVNDAGTITVSGESDLPDEAVLDISAVYADGRSPATALLTQTTIEAGAYGIRAEASQWRPGE